MPDSYDAALARTATRKRIDPKMQALIADMMTPEGHPASAPKPIVPPSQPIDGPGFFKQPQRAVTGSIRDAVNDHLIAQGVTPPGFLEEAYRAIAGGLRDAAQQSVELVNTTTHGIKERMQDTPFGRVGGPAVPAPEAPKLPEVEGNETVPGRYARRMVSLAAPLGAAVKAGWLRGTIASPASVSTLGETIKSGAILPLARATAVAGAPLGAALYGSRAENLRQLEKQKRQDQKPATMALPWGGDE